MSFLELLLSHGVRGAPAAPRVDVVPRSRCAGLLQQSGQAIGSLLSRMLGIAMVAAAASDHFVALERGPTLGFTRSRDGHGRRHLRQFLAILEQLNHCFSYVKRSRNSRFCAASKSLALLQKRVLRHRPLAQAWVSLRLLGGAPLAKSWPSFQRPIRCHSDKTNHPSKATKAGSLAAFC